CRGHSAGSSRPRHPPQAQPGPDRADKWVYAYQLCWAPERPTAVRASLVYYYLPWWSRMSVRAPETGPDRSQVCTWVGRRWVEAILSAQNPIPRSVLHPRVEPTPSILRGPHWAQAA